MATKMKSTLLTLSLYLFFTCSICYATVHSSINQRATDIRINKLERNEGTSSIETSIKLFRETNSIFKDVSDEYKNICRDCKRISLKVTETKNKFPFVSTYYDTVYVPLESPVSEETIRHEFGHVIRYVCFGNQDAFLRFVASFNLLRGHSCRRRASPEFSFNEGWAHFWSGGCDDERNRGSRSDVEGDVAHSLRSLQRRCGSTKREMVKVLCDNPGRVRTYPDFENYHQRMYRCS